MEVNTVEDSGFDFNYTFGETYEYYKSSQKMKNYLRKFSDNVSSPEDGFMEKSKRKLSCEPSDFKIKFKTEICKYWKNGGQCPFQDQCAFAHGSIQLRSKTHLPNNYKTKKCKNYHEIGYCCYGTRCQYIHSSYEEMSSKGQPSPNKYQNQLRDIDYFWDNKQMCFSSPQLQPVRPRLATFESLTSCQEGYGSPITIHESVEDLSL